MRLAHQNCLKSQPRAAQFRIKSNSTRLNISKRQAIKASSEEQQPTPTPTPSATNICKFCGADSSKIPWGCDQEGRIMGGMAAIPGFGWWPIKAYRPCPRAGEAGKRYSRKGQVIDEVLFGASDKTPPPPSQ